MDGSNRLLADLSEAQDTNSRLLKVMVKGQQLVGQESELRVGISFVVCEFQPRKHHPGAP